MAYDVKRVSRNEAKTFIERACRNWDQVQLDADGLDDMADALTDFAAAWNRRATPPVTDEAVRQGGIYIASKTAHGRDWRELRATGVPIISTWIDEAEAGATSDWPDLWSRCVEEASTCAALVVYREPGEVLKGAWVEVGAALAAGRPVFAVGIDEFSVRHHPGITRCDLLADAVGRALATARLFRGGA